MCQVKRRSFLSLSAAILGGGLIADKTAHSLQNGGQDAPAGVYHHVQTVSVMTETANRFLAALSSEQRANATFKFNDDERMNWHFVPIARKGLPMSPSRALARTDSDSIRTPDFSFGATMSIIACMIEGTPAITMTLPIMKPGARMVAL